VVEENYMKSLTLHNIDEPLLALVKECAKSQNLSINQFLKDLIEKSIGYKRTKQPRFAADFKDICGVWTQEARLEFDNSINDFEKTDPEDWR